MTYSIKSNFKPFSFPKLFSRSNYFFTIGKKDDLMKFSVEFGQCTWVHFQAQQYYNSASEVFFWRWIYCSDIFYLIFDLKTKFWDQRDNRNGVRWLHGGWKFPDNRCRFHARVGSNSIGKRSSNKVARIID